MKNEYQSNGRREEKRREEKRREERKTTRAGYLPLSSYLHISLINHIIFLLKPNPTMKLLEKDFAVNQTGSAKIVAEEPDDVWVLYNLILPGDVVSADTSRKIHLDSSSKHHAASRVKLTLHLKVTTRDFHKDSSTLRLHGRNLHHNQHVAAGSFHTLTLEPNKPFHLCKKLWQNDAVQALNEKTASQPSNSNPSNSPPDLAVVLFHQHHAEIHLVGQGATARCIKVEPTKKTASGSAFFRQVFSALVKHVDFNVVKSVVMSSEEFRRFVWSEARRLRKRWLEENKTRMVVVPTGGHEGDLGKVLGDPAVTDLVKDVKVGAFRELWEMVCNDSGRACYGSAEVERAREVRAIETLLICDELYRNDEVGTRLRYEGLVKSVKEGGGKAFVYSSMHVSAPQLAQLTGVAAILRFPLPLLHHP
ncbi:hypothetical protein Fmac_006432 [Flemingia macrophylla]|uniref:eRF1/Pelota-like N-terminal domain-containing protein n=1 Tax=Flemingia macrophylla TaxID=520843 RepID=A0ABD1NAL1_9FABA